MQEKISLLVDHAHSQGFTLLRPDHFIENRFTDANLEHWKDVLALTSTLNPYIIEENIDVKMFWKKYKEGLMPRID